MPMADRHAALDLSSHGLVELPSEERTDLSGGAPAGSPHRRRLPPGELDAEIGDLGCEKMAYYSSLNEAPLAAN